MQSTGPVTETTDGVAAEVIAMIAKRSRVEDRNIDVSDRLDELGIDSLSAVELIFDLEEKFDIEIQYNANDARPEFETVGQVVDAIKKLRSGKS